jgi:hypothetical protein
MESRLPENDSRPLRPENDSRLLGPMSVGLLTCIIWGARSARLQPPNGLTFFSHGV